MLRASPVLDSPQTWISASLPTWFMHGYTARQEHTLRAARSKLTCVRIQKNLARLPDLVSIA